LASWHAQRLQTVVRPLLTAMLVGSLAFGLIFPALAIHQELAPELIGAWRGLANHKNSFGALACMALIFWIHAGLSGEVNAFKALTGSVIAIVCLLLSRSSTSLAAAVFATVLLGLLLRAPQGLRPYVPYIVGALALTLLVYAIAILNLIPGLGVLLAPVTALSNKGINLTGRTDIWAIILEHISRHPLLGTGYAAYWTAGPIMGTESYEFMWRMNLFYPGSAHNGYLEVVNDLGWAGLACLLAYLVTYLRQALQLFAIDRKQAALCLAIFFQQATTNLAETRRATASAAICIW
jgi:O-antigen ligase